MAKTKTDPIEIEEVSQRLVDTRVALGLTQSTIARTLKISLRCWNNYELARKRPELKNASRMAAEFNLTLDWIYLGDDSGLPPELRKRITVLRANRVRKTRRAA